ncbi:MAG TPA: hypothetical protein VGO28_00605 [Acidimicrobiia bacterium]
MSLTTSRITRPATAVCVAATLALGACSSDGGGGSKAKSEVQKFLNELDAAVRDGNTDLRAARLHPAVIERYGEQQCRDFLAGQQDKTRRDKVKEVGKAESFEYATDNLAVTVADALPVQVQSTIKGKKGERDIHLARVNGQLTYFIDCGGPLIRQ